MTLPSGATDPRAADERRRRQTSSDLRRYNDSFHPRNLPRGGVPLNTGIDRQFEINPAIELSAAAASDAGRGDERKRFIDTRRDAGPSQAISR